jgi:hypothetical protein
MPATVAAPPPRPAAENIYRCQDSRKHGKIGCDQHHHAGAETFEKRRIEIGRERAIWIVNVSIQHRATGQPPGDVKFLAEINHRVRPFTPGDCDEEKRHSGQQGKTDPISLRRPFDRDNLFGVRLTVFTDVLRPILSV